MYRLIDWLIELSIRCRLHWLTWLFQILQSKKGRRNKLDDSDEEEAGVERKEQPAAKDEDALPVKEKGKKGAKGKASKVC